MIEKSGRSAGYLGEESRFSHVPAIDLFSMEKRWT